jgi:GntR family uxuAB operon transcriptional repressor
MNGPKQRRPGSAEIAAELRHSIVSGELGSHQRLAPERLLASQYGVARGTVREALSQLATEGLLEIKAGSGAYVRKHDASSTLPVLNVRPLELIDARFALEPHICRLAVLHARQQDLIKLEELQLIMEDNVHNPVGFSQADAAFHTLLAESTGNTLLIWIQLQINLIRNEDQWSQMRQLTLNEETINQYNSQHRQILDAICSREPERAASSMKEHLEYARLSLTRAAAT